MHQSIQRDHGYATTVDGLIPQVITAFQEEFPPAWKLENGFLTHQCCLNEILESHGDNFYKIPHIELTLNISKEKWRREGILPLAQNQSFGYSHGGCTTGDARGQRGGRKLKTRLKLNAGI
jgi:hypothetical protein